MKVRPLLAKHAVPMLISILFLSPARAAERLSLDAARAALSQALKDAGREAQRAEAVRGVVGCLPAFQAPDQWVCPLRVADLDEPMPTTFLRTNKGWRVIEKGASPACAPIAVASAAFGQRVQAEIDAGEGLFTSERGFGRDRKGPYRVMCRYVVGDVEDDQTLWVAYVWHDGDRYIIDADVERWPLP